jgi:hypothetical protein
VSLQLSLSSANGSNSSTLPTIAAALLEAGGKLEVMGSTDEEKGEVSSWLEKIGAGAYEGEAGLKVGTTRERWRAGTNRVW